LGPNTWRPLVQLMEGFNEIKEGDDLRQAKHKSTDPEAVDRDSNFPCPGGTDDDQLASTRMPTNRILNQLMTHASIFSRPNADVTSSYFSDCVFFGPQSSFYRKISFLFACVGKFQRAARIHRARSIPIRSKSHKYKKILIPLRVDSSTNVDRFILVLTR
jgi:hypothetical protein